ncbi:MAG: hypothetical protein RL766_249 [Bacteroidota bacterium]
MKFISILLVSLTTQLLFAQEKKTGDEILGIWLTGSGNGKVEIYKNGNTFQGKIVKNL